MSYTGEFFAARQATARNSARRIVPWILSKMTVGSVIDVGCGTGGWLASFAEQGVTDIMGLDGPWVPSDQLEFPVERFVSIDFTRPKSFPVERRFDLVISIEVAEHLPAGHAATFIDALVALGDAVLFSGAAPQQEGD